MEFEKLVLDTLNENTVAGGPSSTFGPNVGQTATATSGDNYAKGDARNVFGGVQSGVLTRKGMLKPKTKGKKRRKK
jgi:hypothetical protein